MTTTREQLLHLADRARRGALLPDEGALLADGVTALAAQLDRVQALADRWDRDLPDHVRFLAVAALRFALDPDQQPATAEPPSHLPDGGNAEDCPACRPEIDKTVLYPWICPGPSTEQQPTA